MQPPTAEQRFGPTSGKVTGYLGLAACGAVLVLLLRNDAGTANLRWVVATAIGALVVWSVMLRPRVVLRAGREVELRNVFSSWLVPLALVRGVSVKAITRVETEDGRYDGVAVGRRVRQLVRESRAGRPAVEDKPRSSDIDEVDLMITAIDHAAEQARRDGSEQSVRRVWAVPELAALAVLLVALVVVSVV